MTHLLVQVLSARSVVLPVPFRSNDPVPWLAAFLFTRSLELLMESPFFAKCCFVYSVLDLSLLNPVRALQIATFEVVPSLGRTVPPDGGMPRPLTEVSNVVNVL